MITPFYISTKVKEILTKNNYEFMMSKEEFADYVTFEFYYHYFLENDDISISLRGFMSNLKVDSESMYKTVQRLYRVYAKYKEEKQRSMLLSSEVTSYPELKDIEDKLQGHNLRSFHIFQLEQLIKSNEMKKIVKGIFKDSKKTSNNDIKLFVKELSSIYNDIEISEKLSPFEKALQYFQLENNLYLERSYLITKCIVSMDLNKNNRSEMIHNMKALYSITDGERVLQNRFLKSNQMYLNILEECKGNIEQIRDNLAIIVNEIIQLSSLRYGFVKTLIDKISFEDLDYNSDDANLFFEKFLAKGQHIIYRDKEFSAADIKVFRAFLS
ncbi:hypothetical protein P5738_23765 [Bacillus cereus]|uniref:hypothetical protein n=1 Tax=Bacillus cereus TaxID=1396 RepID=UPI00240613D1|nr:hypothetical protein [Bacillus cereus]MDF9484540.1 hypothetical protein [Bacillus cereus]MED3576930.1 hypothetical protein [Bacillus thuringiensis]WIV92663.1 hypothetical protein QNH49_25650 [Bacillus bombysepticus]